MKKWILFLLLPAMAHLAHTQNYIPKITSYTTKDGLSSDEVHAIHKDSQGYLWIGTQNGLDRFDGQSFVHFSKTSHPEMRLDRVHHIVEDEAGYLWLLEKNEAFEFNYASPEIILFHPSSGKWLTMEERFGENLPFSVEDIFFMEQQPDGSIFFFCQAQTKGYLFAGGNFKSFKTPDIQRLSDFSMYENGRFYLEATEDNFTNRQIYLVNENGEILKQRKADLPIRIEMEDGREAWLQLTGTDFLVGAKNLDAYQLMNPDLEEQNPVFDKEVIQIDHAIWNEETQLLWLKSPTKVFVIKPDGKLVFQKEIEFGWYDLPLSFDGTTAWFGTKQNGLTKATLQPNYFQPYQLNVEGFNNSARGIFADNEGNVWISTINGFLKKNAEAAKLKSVSKDKIFSSFFKTKSNQLWSFLSGGLKTHDLATGQEQFVPFSRSHFFNPWGIYEARDGNLWAFGHYGFHYIIDPENGDLIKQTQLPMNESGTFKAYWVQKRNAESVWVCTEKGLYILDNEGNYIAHYNQEQQGEYHFPALAFHHLYQDKAGTIWLASGDNGLFEVKDKNDGLEIINHYTTSNNLSCNILHAIYEDEYEYLWISSNEGLMQFDKRTGKVVTYTKEEGLLHNEFNRISHFQAEDGSLYFGGLKGVMRFDPKHFAQVRHKGSNAKLVVTNFQQYSKQQEQFEDLTDQLLRTGTIELEANDRFFKLGLALLNYEEGGTYQYRIKGLYDWQSQNFEGESELNISGLPYGQHVLEIKAQNSKQQAAANTLSYSVLVKRPFYLQVWFIGLAIATLVGIFFLWFKRRTQRMVALREAEQLREMDKMKSKFFANISHELRTPITLILSPLSQMMKNHRNLHPEELEEKLSSIHSNGKSLLNLVNEVLDLSKLEASKLTLHPAPTKISEFIKAVVMSFESAATVKNIEYQFVSFIQKDIVANFDQAKLEKILNNLLSNALKFTSKEGTIKILLTRIEQDLVIKVTDSGRGIDANDLPLIFDRYFQSSRKDAAGRILYEGGTGIGLALTKELVELMEGEITVSSEINKGTEFTLKLPLTLVDVDEAEVSSFPSIVPSSNFTLLEKQSAKVSSTKAKILLVEDNLALQNFIASVLKPYYDLRIANNGVEALEVLEATEDIAFDAIISDVMMPEMDGFRLLEKVKANDRFCAIPFVLLTARAELDDKLRGLRIGVDDYMTKPFDTEELLLRIHNLITNAKNRVALAPEDTSALLEEPKKVIQESKPSSNTQPEPAVVSSQDLDWLAQVEAIAQREIRNAKYTSDDLAQDLIMSKRQLYRKIKRITGLTPMKYIKTVRLQTAKRMLETEEITTLTQVSYAVGFDNPSHFAKSFEIEFGRRPHDLLHKYETPGRISNNESSISNIE